MKRKMLLSIALLSMLVLGVFVTLGLQKNDLHAEEGSKSGIVASTGKFEVNSDNSISAPSAEALNIQPRANTATVLIQVQGSQGTKTFLNTSLPFFASVDQYRVQAENYVASTYGSDYKISWTVYHKVYDSVLLKWHSWTSSGFLGSLSAMTTDPYGNFLYATDYRYIGEPYKLTPKPVTVNYLNESGGAALQSATTIPAGTLDAAWTANRPLTIEKSGITYELNSAKKNGSTVSGTQPLVTGTFTTSAQTVNYYYKEKSDVTITFKFVDQSTNKEIRSSETKKGAPGTAWSLPAPTISGYNFVRSDNTGQYYDQGTFGSSNQTITYYYEAIPEPEFQIVFTKTDADSGARLQGAVFKLQSLKSNGSWSDFGSWGSLTTNSNGQIIIDKNTNASLYADIKNWGGEGNDESFRFREVTAPSGYELPSSPYSNSMALKKGMSGTKSFSMTNKKAAEKGGDVTVRYYNESGSTQIATLKTLSGNVGASWTASRNTTLTYGGDSYTLVSATKNGSTVSGSQPTVTGTYTSSTQTVNYYYRKESTAGGNVTVRYYNESGSTQIATQKTLSGNIGGSWTASRNTTLTYNGDSYTLVSAKKNGNTVSGSQPTITGTYTSSTQTAYYYYRKEETTPIANVTLKVIMTNTKGDAISFPSGTIGALSLYDKTSILDSSYTLSGSTITFTTKLMKGESYRIGQNKEISGYQKYNADKAYSTGTGANQTALIGVNENGNVIYGGMPYPGTEKSEDGVSLSYNSASSTLTVKIENKANPTYALKQLKIPEDTYRAGLESAAVNWTDLFTSNKQLAVVNTQESTSSSKYIVHYLEPDDFTPTLTSTWNSTVGGPRTFNVSIAPSTALKNSYSGISTLIAEASLTFEELAKNEYELQIIVRNQDGDPAEFPADAHPFEAKELGSTTNPDWIEAAINAGNQTQIEFPTLTFTTNTQYRVKQTTTADDSYTKWEEGTQTKSFNLSENHQLIIYGGAGKGEEGEYDIVNQEKKIYDGWTAKYDMGTNTLTFYFVNQQELGGLTMIVPPDMDFGTIETPIRSQKDVFLQSAENQPDWKILVSDERKNNRNQWTINAQMKDSFINTQDQKQLPSGILKFKSAAGVAAQDLSKGAQLYQSVANPPLATDLPITWTADSGFYLDLQAYGYYPEGNYQATIDFTLETTP